MSAGESVLLAFVKPHLRIASETTVMDEEVHGLIVSALADMQMRGIDTDRACPQEATAIGAMKPLAVRAVVYYCKANFGVAIDKDESAQFWARYDGLTQSMSHTREYMLAAPDNASA